ncbi:MAG: RNA-directed DNA polymerase [Eggerthellaceae bacterium]|nr:RNA-directed DNA polymerase [Eggerthellaceae bacterium]
MRNVFERSANRSNGNNVAYCYSTGNLNNNNANNGNYCAPDCVAKAGYIGIPSDRSPATQSKEPPSCACGREQIVGPHAPALRGGGASAAPAFDDAFGFEPLLEAGCKCLRGVMWKGTSEHAYLHMVETVSRLCDELHAGTYRMRPAREFAVTSPKVRTISSIALSDRIVQRSLNDNVIYPIMSRSWIYDNYACQHGKGTDFARARMSRHLERFSREHGEGYALKVDVRGYYAHMLHSVVDARFASKLPGWAADFASWALSAQYGGEVGYKPGSQMVQIAGIDYLDPLDHAIKERMGARYYGRYMDDLILIDESRGYLESCLAEITRRLGFVGLGPHPGKTAIQPLSKPLGFLGFDYRVRDGGVRMDVKPEKVKAQKRRMRGLARLVKCGRVGLPDYLSAVECMAAHDAKGGDASLAPRLKAYGGMLLMKGA